MNNEIIVKSGLNFSYNGTMWKVLNCVSWTIPKWQCRCITPGCENDDIFKESKIISLAKQ